MAQKVLVALVDDVDGSDAVESVKFALDGVAYEIDLSAKNAQKLRSVLEPYVEVARGTGGRASRGRTRSARSTATSDSSDGRKVETSDIRAWAKAEGYDVSDRGRVPADIIDAYHKKR